MKDYALIIIISYILGNLSSAYIIGKMVMKEDVRKYGSGNSGATNALRVFGPKLAIIAFIGDLLKGMIAVYIGKCINPEFGGYIAGISVIIGHNWPVMLKFKGGKGITTSIGAMLMINPIVSLICFGIGFPIAFLTRTVSLGSLIGMILSVFVVGFFIKPFNKELFIFTLIIVIMSIYKHRGNIARLIKGEENKL